MSNQNINKNDIKIKFNTPDYEGERLKMKKQQMKEEAERNEKKIQSKNLINQIQNKRQRVEYAKTLITEDVGYPPPIRIPTMPQPNQNMDILQNQLELFSQRLGYIEDQLIDFFRNRGASDRAVDELEDEIDEAFPNVVNNIIYYDDEDEYEDEDLIDNRLPANSRNSIPERVPMGNLEIPQRQQLIDRFEEPDGIQQEPQLNDRFEEPEEILAQETGEVLVKPGDPQFDPNFPDDQNDQPNDQPNESNEVEVFNRKLSGVSQNLENWIDTVIASKLTYINDDMGYIQRFDSSDNDFRSYIENLIQTTAINDRLDLLNDIDRLMNKYESLEEDIRELQSLSQNNSRNQLTMNQFLNDDEGNLFPGYLDSNSTFYTLAEAYEYIKVLLQDDYLIESDFREFEDTDDNDDESNFGIIGDDISSYNPDEDDSEFIDRYEETSEIPANQPELIDRNEEPISIPQNTLVEEFDSSTIINKELLSFELPSIPLNQMTFNDLITLYEDITKWQNDNEDSADYDNIVRLKDDIRREGIFRENRGFYQPQDESEIIDSLPIYPDPETPPNITKYVEEMTDYFDRNYVFLSENPDKFDEYETLLNRAGNAMTRLIQESENPESENIIGTGAENYADEYIRPVDPNVKTDSWIQSMDDGRINNEITRIQQYASDYDIGRDQTWLNDYLTKLYNKLDDSNLQENDETLYSQSVFRNRIPTDENEITIKLNDIERLGMPLSVFENDIMQVEFERLIRLGMRPNDIYKGYQYYMKKNIEKDRFFDESSVNKGDLRDWYNELIQNEDSAMTFVQGYEKSWELLSRSLGYPLERHWVDYIQDGARARQGNIRPSEQQGEEVEKYKEMFEDAAEYLEENFEPELRPIPNLPISGNP